MPDLIALRLARFASVHAVLAVVTGAYVAAAQSKAFPADPDMALSAHLDAWFGLFTLAAVGWVVPMTSLGERGRNAVSWLFIVGTVSNVIVTGTKAALGVHGVVPDANVANDAVFAVLNVVVVPPIAIGAFLLAYGAWKPRA